MLLRSGSKSGQEAVWQAEGYDMAMPSLREALEAGEFE